jgi:hypothetical protein
MTSKSAEPREELRQLLRRIEALPTDEVAAPVALRAGRRSLDEAPPPPLVGRPLAPASEPSLPRQRALATPLLFGAVAVAAAGAAAWSLRAEWPESLRLGWLKVTGGSRSHDEMAAASAGSGAPGGVLPAIQAGPVREARVAQPAPPHNTPKPVLTMPSINATSGQRVRVTIHVEPNTFSTGAFQVSVRGLPGGARFVPGVYVAPDRWVIPASDLGALELALGDAPTGRFEIACELRNVDGKPIVETSSVLVVTAPSASAAGPLTTASVPPRQPPAHAPAAVGADRSTTSASAAGFGDSERVDQAGQERLLVQGLRLLVLGNINSARLLFGRAADAGNAHAALILGDTFDDARLVQLGVFGVQPDRDKAVYWYERADELGAPEAKERLADMNTR